MSQTRKVVKAIEAAQRHRAVGWTHEIRRAILSPAFAARAERVAGKSKVGRVVEADHGSD